MSSIGNAYVNIVPKFDSGFNASVKSAVTSAMGTASQGGTSLGSGIADGMKRAIAGAGAISGIVSSVTSKAMDLVSSQVGNAISRFDTLNRYPRVMESLGYSASDASASIKLMSDRLQGLPTALDTMASTVQGLTAITGDMDQATRLGLALNDMLVAGGASTQLANSAMEQFRQILSKGKPEMQDWRTLVQAMPGQMDQLAKSMLGPTANANDLYQAIGGGDQRSYTGENIPLDEFISKIIELDEVGGDGITSFAEQAQSGAGGVQTAMTNVYTAVSRGIANTLDVLGEERIVGWIGGFKQAVEGAFSGFNDLFKEFVPDIDSLADGFGGLASDIASAFGPVAPVLADVAHSGIEVVVSAMQAAGPYIEAAAGLVEGVARAVGGVLDAVKPFAGEVVAAFAAFSVAKGVTGVLTPVVGGITGIANACAAAGGGVGGLATVISQSMSLASPAGLAVAAIAGAIGLVAANFIQAKSTAEDYTKAVEGMASVSQQTRSLQGFRAQIEEVGSAAEGTALNLRELWASGADAYDGVTDTLQTAKQSIGELAAAWDTIKEYAGKTNLTDLQAGEVMAAAKVVSEATGIQVEAADVARGAYEDEQGAVHDLIGELEDLVQKKLYVTELDALTETMSTQKAEVDKAAASVAAYNKVYDTTYQTAYYDALEKGCTAIEADTTARQQATTQAELQYGALSELTGYLNSSRHAYQSTAEEAGRLSSVMDGTADEWTQLGVALSRKEGFELANATLQESGYSMYHLLDTLDMYGVGVEDASKLTAQQLETMARHYDGTVGSIAGDLDAYNVAIDATRQNQHALTDALDATINALGEGTVKALGDAGMSTFELADALSEAGVQTRQLSEVGGANISALAELFDGDIGAMVEAIQRYNGESIVDKDGNVSVQIAELESATGEIYAYNGTQLLDKETGVEAEYGTLVEANGEVRWWNGTKLVKLEGEALARYQEVVNARGAVKNLRDMDGFTVRGTATVTYDSVLKAKSAVSDLINKVAGIGASVVVGGSRNAAGGIRKHAAGAIVDAPGSGYPLDLVGEDGAEAIVPLTNRSYAQPFVDMIASEVAKRSVAPVSYTIGDVNIDVSSLEGVLTVQTLFDRLKRAKRAS